MSTLEVSLVLKNAFPVEPFLEDVTKELWPIVEKKVYNMNRDEKTVKFVIDPDVISGKTCSVVPFVSYCGRNQGGICLNMTTNEGYLLNLKVPLDFCFKERNSYQYFYSERIFVRKGSPAPSEIIIDFAGELTITKNEIKVDDNFTTVSIDLSSRANSYNMVLKGYHLAIGDVEELISTSVLVQSCKICV